MRKGSGTSGGAGLYNNLLHHPQLQQQQLHNLHHHHLTSPASSALVGGGPIIPPNLQQQFQQQQQHLQSSMVQQRATTGGGAGGGGGRMFVGNHHPHHQGGGGNPYLNQGGVILPHHLHGGGGGHHSGGGGTGLPHLVGGPHQMHHGQRPIIPHGGAGFGSHPSGMGQGMVSSGQYGNTGPVASGINSHFGTSGSGSSSGGGGGSSSHSGTGGSGGGGDLPPVETVVARLETACRLLHGIGGNNTRVVEISGEIQILSEDLRRVGAMLENTYPEVLDRVMSSMRDASAQPCLPPSLRLAIFELVELRASKWMLPSDSSNYYRQRRNLNDAAAPEQLLEERSGRNSASGNVNNSGGGGSANSQVTVVVTGATQSGTNNNTVKPETIFSGSGGGASGVVTSSSPNNQNVVDLDTPPQPQPAKTYREEIVIKNSDSGKVAPTAKERVLSINGYSQQSINLAKQLIQETITRNASPVLDGMVPGSTGSGAGGGPSGEFSDISGALVEEAELGLKRMQLQQSGASSSSTGASKLLDHPGSPHHHSPSHSSHFSYTVTLGDHSIKILGDDLQYVQEAKMALDDYFLQKYPDLFCANLNGIEDVEEEEEEDVGNGEDEDDEDEDFHDGMCYQRRPPPLSRIFSRETLLNLSKVRTPPPDFSHLEPDIRGTIVLEKPRQFDVEKFARETNSSTTTTTTTTTTTLVAASNNNSSTTTITSTTLSTSAATVTNSSNNNKASTIANPADVLPG